MKAAQFEVVPAGDLYTVVDTTTGGAISGPTFRVLAEDEASSLNEHAGGGGSWLAAVLGGTIEPEGARA